MLFELEVGQYRQVELVKRMALSFALVSESNRRNANSSQVLLLYFLLVVVEEEGKTPSFFC